MNSQGSAGHLPEQKSEMLWPTLAPAFGNAHVNVNVIHISVSSARER